ncbi:hypothetical protein DdX_21241 [Ditylenchus destructor]|uniref:Uncharacterized protein n=1 Tax=Ditylenchus destructor TaxID=166010 RepID=A0AAD4MJY9_9BILA|nr:hypothetical protein DdX_21241 [Ditylenchus destructor]
MQTPFVLISLAFLVFISQQQLSEANCGNGVSNSDEANCRKDEAPNLIKKNGNRGSSSDSDSDSGGGDSDSDSGSDDNGDGDLRKIYRETRTDLSLVIQHYDYNI